MATDAPGPRSQDVLVPQTVERETQTEEEQLEMETRAPDAVVPMVRVHLIQTTRIPANKWVMAEIKAEAALPPSPIIFQPEGN